MSYLRSILRNALSNWANLLVTLLISFFMAPYILKCIGNTFYGIWVLVAQTTGYLWLLDFGVRESIIKYVAEFNEKKDFSFLSEVLGSSIRIYSLVCVICVTLSLLLSVAFPHLFKITESNRIIAQLVVIITGLDIAQAFFFNIFTGILMGFQRYDIFSKINIGFSILRAIGTIIALKHGFGIVALAFIQLICNLGTNILIYFIARTFLPVKILSSFKQSKNIKARSLILNYSSFVLLNNICLQAIFYSSNIIIASFLPIANVTFFAIAANLIEYLKKMIFTGTQVFAPLTSQLDAKNEPHVIAELLVKGSKFSLILCLPVAVVYLILGKQFIGLWMGTDYSEISGTILMVLSVAIIFSVPHYTIQGILLGLNKHKILAYVRAIEAISNIALSILFIKKFGLIGVAYGSAIPHLIMVIFVLPICITRIVGLTPLYLFKNAYIAPTISVIPFLLACYFASIHFSPNSLALFFLEIAGLLVFYVLGIWIFGINQKERTFIKGKISSFLAPAS